jgi:hypothetical protein
LEVRVQAGLLNILSSSTSNSSGSTNNISNSNRNDQMKETNLQINTQSNTQAMIPLDKCNKETIHKLSQKRSWEIDGMKNHTVHSSTSHKVLS